MKDFERFLHAYYEHFAEVLRSFDKSPMMAVLSVLQKVQLEGGILWVAGNGGSAAISEHAVCDSTKGTFVDGRAALRAVSLCSNTPLWTAIANDTHYDQVFRKQLELYLKNRDAVLLVSSSGSSANVVEACEYANERNVPTVAFVGFRGGRLAEIARHVVWVPVENYGIVEDTHQSLIHVLSQYLKALNEDKIESALCSLKGSNITQSLSRPSIPGDSVP